MAEYGDGRSTSSRDALSLLLRSDLSTSTSLVFSMNHILLYLFLSREDDDDVRDTGKYDFRSVLLHPTLSNANLSPTSDIPNRKSSMSPVLNVVLQ